MNENRILKFLVSILDMHNSTLYHAIYIETLLNEGWFLDYINLIRIVYARGDCGSRYTNLI